MESTGHDEPKPVKRPRFWVGPFVAGCCFALGYGITHRLVTLQSNAETPTPESFEPALFPGESMEALRGRNGGEPNSFQVDLKALEDRLAAERDEEPDAEELALEAQQAEQAPLAEQGLQATGPAPAPPVEPNWTEPTLPAPEPDPEPTVVAPEPPMTPPMPPAPPVQPAVVTEPLPPPAPVIEEPTPLPPPPPLPAPALEPLPAQP